MTKTTKKTAKNTPRRNFRNLPGLMVGYAMIWDFELTEEIRISFCPVDKSSQWAVRVYNCNSQEQLHYRRGTPADILGNMPHITRRWEAWASARCDALPQTANNPQRAIKNIIRLLNNEMSYPMKSKHIREAMYRFFKDDIADRLKFLTDKDQRRALAALGIRK